MFPRMSISDAARASGADWQSRPSGERQKVGGQAALTSVSCLGGCGLNFGYQRRNRSSRSSLRTLVLVCSKRCAPRSVHCICCFLTNRLLTTWLIVDSTNAVLIVFSLPSTLAEVRDELPIIADVCSKVIEAVGDLLRSVRTGLNETQLH